MAKELLSESPYVESHKSTRRTASLALPRTTPLPSAEDEAKFEEEPINTKPMSRRMSLSPWPSRPNTIRPDNENVQAARTFSEAKTEKKGLWNWKPIRALSHIGMQKLNCLLSVEVITAQGLPASMNGLRLSVCVRKKETKDGAVNTMPSPVQQGAADFEETLFIRCNVYKQQQQLRFEPRPFLISLFAVDAEELDFGRDTVDLSLLIQESLEKSYEGGRQWELSFNLLGKAKGGELIVKLGFQLMEKDGGIGIYNYNQAEKSMNFSFSSISRKKSKASFSVLSPKIKALSWTPSQKGVRATDLQQIDDFNLDEPAPAPVQKSDEPGKKEELVDILDFEVEDKGVEVQVKEDISDEVQDSEEKTDEDNNSSSSVEVVKEVVQDQLHVKRSTELDSVALQIKAPEDDEDDDADEETVLEGRDYNLKIQPDVIPPLQPNKAEGKVHLKGLGKGLGCVVIGFLFLSFVKRK